MQHVVLRRETFLERESPSGLRRETNQQQSQVRLNFKVFNDVDNRAKALDKKNKR